ncbi:MAG: hypothetical protein WDN45_04035 [Caulobacteraceae bacterium]
MISVATFASSLAHEVNQPVAAIVANSEAALRWLAKDPPNLKRRVQPCGASPATPSAPARWSGARAAC